MLNPLFTQIVILSWYSLSFIYPLPYERTEWHYNRANSDLIQRATDLFDWDKAVRINDMDKQVAIFSDILINIIQNFVPHETIIFDDRHPPWMNKEMKQLIEKKRNFTNDSSELIKLYFI